MQGKNVKNPPFAQSINPQVVGQQPQQTISPCMEMLLIHSSPIFWGLQIKLDFLFCGVYGSILCLQIWLRIRVRICTFLTKFWNYMKKPSITYYFDNQHEFCFDWLKWS